MVPNLSEDSMYPLQTGIATKELNSIKNSRASLSNYGMTKMSVASDVTDANAYALSAVEKNASISDTLANQIKAIKDSARGFIAYTQFTGTTSWADTAQESSDKGIWHSLDTYLANHDIVNDESCGSITSAPIHLGGPLYWVWIQVHSTSFYSGYAISYCINFSWFRYNAGRYYLYLPQSLNL